MHTTTYYNFILHTFILDYYILQLHTTYMLPTYYNQILHTYFFILRTTNYLPLTYYIL